MPLTAEQLAERVNMVTASDAAAIVGLDPYRTALDVWSDKVLGKTFRGNYATRRGDALEPLLLDALGEHLGEPHRVAAAGGTTRRHRVFDWLGATPDGLVYCGGDSPVAIAEAKATRQIDQWRGEDGEWRAPDRYAVQVLVQMMVTGLRRAYFTVDLAGEHAVCVEDFDQDAADALTSALEHFHRTYLVPKARPPVGGSPYASVANAWRRNVRAEMVTASVEADRLAERYALLRTQRKDLDAELDTIKAKLCAEIGDADGIVGSGWKATWKERAEVQVPATVRKAYRHFDLREIGTKGGKR